MELFQAVILAVVQGATEFLPISSSGHVALCAKLLQLREDVPLDFVVVIHFGTLLAVLFYYREDLLAMLRSLVIQPQENPEETNSSRMYRRLFGLLILATIPAAAAGYALEDAVESAFSDVRLVGAGLVFTALVLATCSRLSGRKAMAETGVKEALTVGLCQAAALVPGVSRSGCTIAGGLLSGFSREWAPRFAFLLSVPVILGGTLLSASDMITQGPSDGFDALTYVLSALIAGIVGYLSIILVTDSVKRGNLLYYSVYCLAVGLTAIATGFFLRT